MSAQSYGSRWSHQFVTSTARLRGAVVRIKELKFPRKRDISREIMKEMRLLRELRHDNINSFIGACVEPTRILLVTDYCAKGSLYDIIENEDIKLDDLFIASLINDLIKVQIVYCKCNMFIINFLSVCSGHDVHTQFTADLSRQSQILELRGHLPLDAAGNRFRTARAAPMRRKRIYWRASTL